MARPTPPPDEVAIGLASYLTDTPGIGGRLRTETEDFRVIELGDGPPAGDGPFAAVRIELRNWETNRFAGIAAKEIGIKTGHVGFSGMKDKRAVTEQWFTFRCKEDRVAALERLQDVRILEGPYRAKDRSYAGSHTGNRFVLRIRDHNGALDAAEASIQQIRAQGGVPHFFGPQRFGAGVRPITPLMGEAIVRGDLEGAVRLYCGTPFEGEHPEAHAARSLFHDTGDAEAALAIFPPRLDFERSILQRLAKDPGQWRYALMALPQNLLQLFVHSYRSLLFNRILSARIEEGLGLRTAHIGDRVMAHTDDGTHTIPVTATNQARVQREIDAGRAAPTAPLFGLDVALAEGAPGDIEERILAEHEIDARAFRCRELPQLASKGRRRTVLQAVSDLELAHVEGDPRVSFSLGKGSYATVVMREIMKTGLDAY